MSTVIPPINLQLQQLQDVLYSLHGQMSWLLPEFSLRGIISWGAAAAMVFGGMVPFMPQYRDIKRSGNADGFSTFVCLTLLIANILRIMFWFGKHFELPLLAQSIIMVFTMLLMVQLCVQVKNKSEIVVSKPHQLTDFDPNHFWQWTDFNSYIQFTVLFTAVVSLLTFLMLNSIIYIELIGFLAVFAEALLGAPQFYRNFQNKSTEGMSKKMVGFWTCGDIFKTGYFIIREAPPQFWICGMLQVSIDISIFMQVFIYRNLRSRGPKFYTS